jgi:DNA helicase II / ATP-dependent DNA helicase PcrA
VWERYHTLKSERSLLDFDDLIYRTVQLLESNEPVTAALRQRWTHLHVDEYQDTNSAQYRLVQLLCGPERNLCVVGDTDQTIYTWRGAEIKNLMQFERDFPNTTTVLLEENYRSSKTIIAVANDCIRKNSTRIDKTLFTNNPDGDMVKLLVATNEQDEARQVARAVNQLIQTAAKPAEIALLYRANFQSQALEKAFISAGIQYDLLGTKFYARRAIKDMLAYLRFALNPDNAADLQRIAGVPKRGVGPKTTQAIIDGTVDQLSAGARSKAEKFIDELSGIRAAVNTKPVPEAIEHILAVTGWAQSLATDGSKSKAHNLENEDELENLAELITVAEQYADFEAPLGVEKLLEEAALMAEADTIDSEENQSVRMMTIHASKGLEFDHVFITGLEEGLFPSDRSDAARDQEEERRLFYVALTRARQTACLSYATMRHRFGSYTFNTPSEFITEIDPQYLDDSLAGASGSSGTNRLLDIEF